MRFSQYILESNGDFVLNEKLGNLNASNDPKYTFLLKAALKNKNLRGLTGPNSKIVTLTGKGRPQFIKDLRDVQKKIGDPQLVFLTTEYKVTLIKNNDDGKWDDSSSSYIPNPVSAHLATTDIFIANINTWDLRNGPVLPKTDVESMVTSAKGNLVIRRLKNSLDRAALDDDTDYHAVVILPDPDNFAKNQQRTENYYKTDKYEVGSSGTTRFMRDAKYDADKIRRNREKERIGYEMEWMTTEKARELIFDSNTTINIDGVTYKKDPAIDEQQCMLTKDGRLKMINLYNIETYKDFTLVYNFRTKKFTIENRW
jgi:hypothetical protein|nr:MAG TPA: hypothetical protein [Ackermannviridae sp.]